jgi:hypothetical protein
MAAASAVYRLHETLHSSDGSELRTASSLLSPVLFFKGGRAVCDLLRDA